MEYKAAGEIVIFDAESDHVQLYNPEENALTPSKTLTKKSLSGFTAITLGDHVYVISESRIVHRLGCCSTKSEWERLKDTVEDHGPCPPAVAMKGRIYLAGGVEAASKVENYDPATGKWELLSAMKVMEIVHNTLVAAQGWLYSVGGKSPHGYTRRDCERLDPTCGCWNLIAPMREERWSAAAVEFNGRIIVLGGFNDHGEPLPTAEIYDPSANVWIEMINMLMPRAMFDAIIIKDEIYIFDKTKREHYERYNISTKERTEVLLPRSIRALAAVK